MRLFRLERSWGYTLITMLLMGCTPQQSMTPIAATLMPTEANSMPAPTERPTQPVLDLVETRMEPTGILPTSTATITPPPPDASTLITRLYKEEADYWDYFPTSRNGRYTVFSAYPEVIGFPDDPLNNIQAYLYDHALGEVRALSVNESGEPASFWSTPSMISGDGSTAAFWSYSTNLVDLQTECEHPEPMGTGCELGHVYIANIFTGELQHIEVRSGYGLGMVNALDLSYDGRHLAFSTNAGMVRDGAWVLDRVTGSFTQISEKGLGVDISDDGRILAYLAFDDGAFGDDQNQAEDVFIMNLQTGERIWVTKPQPGIEPIQQPSGFRYYSEGGSAVMSLSPDGRHLVFVSGQVGLTALEVIPCEKDEGYRPPSCIHLYLYEVETGAMEMIDVTPNGQPSRWGASRAQVSPDGRYVVFEARGNDLVDGAGIPCVSMVEPCLSAIYLRDRVTDTTYLLSQTYHGEAPKEGAELVSLEPDGRSVIYTSQSNEIVPGLEPLPDNPREYRPRLYIVNIAALIGSD